MANLTRDDGRQFLDAVRRAPLRVHATPYPLEEANQALDDLRRGQVQGAAVLMP